MKKASNELMYTSISASLLLLALGIILVKYEIYPSFFKDLISAKIEKY